MTQQGTPDADSVTAADVEAAALRLGDLVERTPLTPSARLSEVTGARVLLKREDLQQVRSYKVRGAVNLIAQLTEAERACGVTCASAGNHAQGVAHACRTLGVDARIHLPGTTPRQKRDRVATLGGDSVDIVITGDTYDEAAAASAAFAHDTGATPVAAFDDPRTIAGQGTVVAEVVADLESDLDSAPDVVVVPVGGGGLAAGTIAWLRERHPETRIVLAEPAGAASMAAAVAAGGPVDLPELDPFVDGASVRRVGQWTHPIVARGVAEGQVELVTVPEGAICVEMLALYQVEGIIAEPAGALASAALQQLDLPAGALVVAVLSGGNNDVSRYADIVERALVHEGRKHYFLVDFPQEPGALRRFLDEVLGPDDDIALFEYVKRNNRETGPALVGIELGSAADLPGLLARMDAAPPTAQLVPPDSPLSGFILS
ncbi:threonine ammonia-lyase IlvA [Janibacter sp. G56]|uniref:threonine ammonia-lyase IlvA n=1 Tax=Janibacter sp. G56 TaxID=3418717 RepID=UPI003D007090